MRRRDKLAFKLKVVIGTLLIGAIGFCLLSISLAAKEKIIYMSTPWGVPSKNLLAEFEKQTGIEVEVTTIGDEKALRDKVMIATAGGIAPADVIFVGITNVGVFSSSKSIAQLDEIVSPDLLEQLTSADLFRIGGYLYSVPIYQQLVKVSKGVLIA